MKLVALGNLQQQARFRFTAIARFLRPMWAEKNGIDAPARRSQLPVHFRMNGVQRRHVKHPPPKPGLIGCNHHMPARPVEQGHGFERAWHRNKLFGHPGKAFAQSIDRAIPVDDNKLERFFGARHSAGDCVLIEPEYEPFAATREVTQ